MSGVSNFRVVHTEYPFYPTDVRVYNDNLIGCASVGKLIEKSPKQVERFLENNFPYALIISHDDTYKGKNSNNVKKLCTLKGLEAFLEYHQAWDAEDIETGMKQLQSKKEENIPLSEQEKNVLDSALKKKLPPNKRSRDEEDIFGFLKQLRQGILEQNQKALEEMREQQKNFLKEAREHIGQEAIYAYSKTKEYQAKLDESIGKRADAVESTLRKELEPKIRESLIKKIRTEEESKLRDQVLIEMDDLGRQLRTQGANNVFAISLHGQNKEYHESDAKRASQLARDRFKIKL